MESREYFEKVMQDYNQNRNGRSLRKYCKDEAVDYNWLQEYKRTYPNETKPVIHLIRSRKKRSLDTIKWRNVQSDKFFQKIMLAVMPVKSGLRSYGGLLLNCSEDGKEGISD